MRVKINGNIIPNSWSTLTYNDYLNYMDSGEDKEKDVIKFFTGYTVDQLLMAFEPDLISDTIIQSLSFLKTPPEKKSGASGVKVKYCSYEQKTIAFNFISLAQEEDGHVMKALPALVALYDTSVYNKSNYNSKLEKIKNRSFEGVYQSGIDIMDQLKESEENLENNLENYRVELDETQKQAGWENMKVHNDFMMLKKLAGGELLNIPQVKTTPLNEVNTFIIVSQKEYFFKNKEAKLRKQKLEADLKKKRKFKRR